MRVGQFRGQLAARKQSLFSVQIGEHSVEQARALANTGLDFLPLVGVDQQRQWIELPRAVGSARVGVDIVVDAALGTKSSNLVSAPRRGAARFAGDQLGELFPLRSRRTAGIEHLVIAMAEVRMLDQVFAFHRVSGMPVIFVCRRCSDALSTGLSVLANLRYSQKLPSSSGMRCAQVEREGKLRTRFCFTGNRRSGAMTGTEEAIQASAFRFKGVDREIVVTAAAGMGDVVLAAAERALVPAVNQIERER